MAAELNGFAETQEERAAMNNYLIKSIILTINQLKKKAFHFTACLFYVILDIPKRGQNYLIPFSNDKINILLPKMK